MINDYAFISRSQLQKQPTNHETLIKVNIDISPDISI